jgi:dephospho-CoA kinase
MGKSTTAQLFVDEGCALWDADAAVHRIYEKGGAAVAPMALVIPDAIVDGAVSRTALKSIIATNPSILKTIEDIVHPLVAQDRAAFLAKCETQIVVLDIPLLFETGGNNDMDAIACVSIPADEQEKRVMDRGTMSRDQFLRIRNKQMPNDEKCARSDFVIVTDSIEHARTQVQDVIKQIRQGLCNA